jgi:hypothetical protein
MAGFTDHEKGALRLFESMLRTAERDCADLDAISRGAGRRMFGQTIDLLRQRIDRINATATAREYVSPGHERAESRLNADLANLNIAGT